MSDETLFAAEDAAGRAAGETPGADGGVYVRVAVERGMEGAGGRGFDSGGATLTYRVAGALGAANAGGGGAAGGAAQFDVGALIGRRVIVPLGKKNRVAPGVIVAVGGAEMLEGVDPAKIKPVSRVMDAAVEPALIELARWMSSYYVCPLGMVLATMTPAAVKHGTGVRERTALRRTTDVGGLPEGENADERAKSAGKSAGAAWAKIAALDAGVFPVSPRELADEIGERTLRSVNLLVKAGLLATVKVREVVARDDEVSGGAGEEAEETDSGDGSGDRSHQEPSHHEQSLQTRPVLLPEQEAVVEGVTKTLGGFERHLLRGVTGSGKTEVYLRLIERVLERGQGAIVLVPEIALTPQTADRFRARFEGEESVVRAGVAVLHSGLTAAQRHREWARVREGRARVVVGARSAVFAPLAGLGLIVVDEEHDTSYKQDQLPRYQARDVAIKRAQIEGCPVLMGSATPSLESWANATGAYGQPARAVLWQMERRATGAPMPAVEIVDMRLEMKLRAAQPGEDPRRLHMLGPTLEQALDETLSAGGQAMLLLNRRGFANYIACPSASCGWVLSCESCDANMVFHKDKRLPRGGVVRCHHCLAEQVLPGTCPVCGRLLNTFGQGTQRVEEELIRKFGAGLGLAEGTTLVRVDSDTMRRARDYFMALSRFASGQVKVLVGTQMIAKGLDFPNVRLVGVVNADTALSLPDFRSAERTFQLLTQVAGRAGRVGSAGRVIFQTFAPEYYAIRLAAEHDYVTFAQKELEFRARGQRPPRTRMARVVCRDLKPERAEAHAQAVADALRGVGDKARVLVEGPMPAPISRIADHYRFAVEVVAPTAADLHRALTALRRAGALKSDSKTAVDVDPVSLL